LKKRCDCGRKKWAKCAHGWFFSYCRGTTVNKKGETVKKEYRFSLDVEARKRDEPRPTTKTDAVQWRDRLRTEIREGKHDAPTAPATPNVPTLGDVCELYLTDFVRKPTRREKGRQLMEDHIRLARATEIAPGVTLNTKPITAVTADDLEAVRAARLAASRARCATTKRRDCKHGEVGANRLLSRLRHLFTWAIKKRHVTASPFRIAHVTVVEMNRDAETRRDRRLIGDEETRLIAAAGLHLFALLEAALTTGCRKGELLSMQWWQVRDAQSEIFIPAPKAKTDRSRTVPLLPRLQAVLAMRKTAPDGQEHGPDAYVFGNEVGEQVKSVTTAWTATRRRAKITDLHFHDLRRECASRWHERGTSLVQVQAWLGHTNIAQTSTYLGVSLAGTAEEKRRLETADGFAHVSHKPPADAPEAEAKPTVM